MAKQRHPKTPGAALFLLLDTPERLSQPHSNLSQGLRTPGMCQGSPSLLKACPHCSSGASWDTPAIPQHAPGEEHFAVTTPSLQGSSKGSTAPRAPPRAARPMCSTGAHPKAGPRVPSALQSPLCHRSRDQRSPCSPLCITGGSSVEVHLVLSFHGNQHRTHASVAGQLPTLGDAAVNLCGCLYLPPWLRHHSLWYFLASGSSEEQRGREKPLCSALQRVLGAHSSCLQRALLSAGCGCRWHTKMSSSWPGVMQEMHSWQRNEIHTQGFSLL